MKKKSTEKKKKKLTEKMKIVRGLPRAGQIGVSFN